MKKIKLVLFGIAAVLTLALTTVVSSGVVRAENEFTSEVCEGLNPDDEDDAARMAALGCDENRTAGEVANGIINIVIGLVGVLAAVILIYGGAKYVISAGRPDKMAQAKNIIAYAVVGLVVALLAFAIVNFVLTEA